MGHSTLLMRQSISVGDLVRFVESGDRWAGWSMQVPVWSRPIIEHPYSQGAEDGIVTIVKDTSTLAIVLHTYDGDSFKIVTNTGLVGWVDIDDLELV